ncbi:AAA family ATPase [Pseudanabaena minima]|uniref:AAA family ATPase n=1 Tax=Pseudanabaena minima TaxID=890415 RepID=UPI003DA86E36
MAEKIRYAEILLPSEELFLKYRIGYPNSISPLSLVNIFIGANNTGKSRLLRALFSLQEFSYNTNIYKENDFWELIDRLDKEFREVFSFPVTSVLEFNSDYITGIFLSFDSEHKQFISADNSTYNILKEKLENLANREFKQGAYSIASYQGARPTNTVGGFPESVINTGNKLRDIGIKYRRYLDDIDANLSLGSEKRYYIPILRGMRPLDVDDQHKNFYGDRTKWDYFRSSDSLTDKMQIFTGLELYQSLKEKLLGEPEERKLVKEFEAFLSANFFESKPVTLIPKEKSPKVVHIKIGEEPQYPIYELGDGLQNLIICTFNIFTEKERCLFFIEEPDMFMHPSLQRSFLEVLSKFDQHQYFITSHSNHFLDMTIDFANISVFHFSKHEGTQPQFHIRPSSPSDRQILLDLGVRNSSVFITNATIWVEGKTDRLYLKAYMKKYIDELEHGDPEKYRQLIKLKEDYHYSFVEYQGANLTHWSFDPDEKETKEIKASYVCAHAFLIADGDVATKGDRKQVYTNMLGERFYLLEVKEIENLLPVEILREIVANKFEKHQVDINSIEHKKYSKPKIPLGKYLDSLLPQPLEKPVFAEKSGTIKAKGTFCDDAVKFMQDTKWSLNNYPKIKILCEKVFDHIITQNKNS